MVVAPAEAGATLRGGFAAGCGDHLPFLSRVDGGRGGGERCRAHPPMPGCRGMRIGSRTVFAARWAVPSPWLPPAKPRPGLSDGGAGHSAAMIASNSAASRSASLQIRSRNWSSLVRAVRSSVAGAEGMTGLTGQALMACRSSPLLVMEILRGLACSATGIWRVSTPAS